MPLEDLTGPDKFFDAFNTNWPTNDDPRPEGDDHIRGVKNVLINMFGPLAASFVSLAHTWQAQQTFSVPPVFPNRIIPAGIFIGWSAGFDANYDYFRARVCDGRTFGKTGSGGDIEDDEMVNLYGHFWSQYADTWIPVTGGRGASAQADWDALKSMKLPDLRGRSLIGDGQGQETVEGDPDFGPGTNRARGETGGTEKHTQTEAEVGEHDHPNSRSSSTAIYGPGAAGAHANNSLPTLKNAAPVPMDWESPFFASPWAVTY